jgi:hypothetical protein
VNSNIAIGSLATLQKSQEIVALFEKIYDAELILTFHLKCCQSSVKNSEILAAANILSHPYWATAPGEESTFRK